MNVLVTSASRKVSLVQAFQRALALEGGRVVAADCQPRSAALHLADRARLVPRGDRPEFWDAFVRLIRDEAIGLVVPTRDEELGPLAERRAELEAMGVCVPVPSPAAVRLCQDKIAFADHCRTHGLSIPDVIDPTAVASARFPVSARARRGKSGKGAFRVDSAAELAIRLAEHGELLVQELVAAPELSLDGFADLEGVVRSIVPRTREVVFGGESFVSRTIDDPRMSALGVRLGAAIGLRGHFVAQVFDRGDRIDVIEVNPRFGGASALAFAAGADSPRALIRLAAGRSIGPALPGHRAGVTMLRYTQDLYLDDCDLERRLDPRRPV